MTTIGASYAYCERLTRRAACNFYPAMQVLPRAQRRGMYALYAYNRLTDDLADGDGSAESKEAALNDWRAKLDEALAGADAHPALAALSHTVASFGIPKIHLHEVIDGCLMDVQPRVYKTFAELYRYCTLVASSVGQACIPIWGYHGERAPQYAEAAGVALQLTNILRDLKEDLARGRVYLPQYDLQLFGLSADRLAASGPSFRALMHFEVDRARRFYDEAGGLDGCLEPAGRAVFRVILETYRGLLDRIETVKYDVFSHRVTLPRWRKAVLVVKSLPLRWGWKRG